ncbi:MAG: hypothetical protein JW810_13985, partial [Sedimentisphaerales bacterium]|nr:hypothetical protein [Sedimentisphaerales bacterium]
MRSRKLHLKGRTNCSIADDSRLGSLRLEALEPRQLLSTVHIPPVIIGDLGPDQADDPLADVTDVYVTLGDNAAKSLSFVDENGTQVSVKYKGGTAELHLVGEDLIVADGSKVVVTGAAVIESIVLDGNSAASQLTVKASGGDDNLTTVGSITGTGDLKKISAGQVDLDGAGLNLTNGCVASLALHDLAGGADLNLPGETMTKGVAVSLNQIGPDSDILLGSPAKKFSALDWQSGSFQLPWAKKVSFAGDLGADMQVTGQGVQAGKPAVTGLDIGGSVSGSLDIQGDLSKASLGGLSGNVSI